MNKGIILVVDDNPELVNGVKLTLEMEGYQVLAATHGKDALKILERITPDLILADIMMPEMDGYEFYEIVHEEERWVQIPFVFLTAKTNQEDIRRGKEMGVDDYLTKPFDPEDMVAAVRGRMKRMAQITGRSEPEEIGDSLWDQKIGPIPVSLIAIALFVLAIFFIARPHLFSEEGSLQISSGYSSPLPTDIEEMVTIPAGEFLTGEEPATEQIFLPEFQIDRYEVTNAQYQEFVEETDRKPPWGTYPKARANYPITNISWEEANTYCLWAEKRLPSEIEWEKAARGTDGRSYPWGNTWDESRANTQENGIDLIQPVGSYPEGVSPYGVHDMAGNAAEWVEDWFGPNQEAKVIRGGSANANQRWARTFARNQVSPSFTQDWLGFRCATSTQASD